MRSRLTSKSQVTVPKAVRERLGLRPRQAVRFVENDRGRIEIEPVSDGDEDERARRYREALKRIDSVRGTIDPELTTDEYMAMIREPLEPFEIEAFEAGRSLV